MKSRVLRANILGEKHKERKDSRESPMKYTIQEAKIIFKCTQRILWFLNKLPPSSGVESEAQGSSMMGS